MDKRSFKHLRFLLGTYLLGIFIFLVIRIVLVLTELDQMSVLPDKLSLMAKAFFMGFRFDTVISCYVLFIPLFVLAIASSFRWENRIFHGILFYYIVILFVVSFFIAAADIPYFNQFLVHINVSIFNWAGNVGFVTKMIFQEKRNWLFLSIFIALMIAFIYVEKKIYSKYLVKSTYGNMGLSRYKYLSLNIIVSVLMLGLVFLGIRGRITQKSPIRVGTAFFSNFSFANQVGLNPVFVFLRSCLDYSDDKAHTIKLMDEKKAVENAIRYLKSRNDTAKFDSPIARRVSPSQVPTKYNVVLVLMEGISGNYLKRAGNNEGLTPFLDSLSSNSYFFDQIYSAGIHTMNGIYGTYYSFPALLRQHPMNWVVMPEFTGFPKVMADNGYTNIFFTTHDEQFDNMGGFLMANSFHRIISQKDYPSDQVRSTLGVPDHFMFEFSMPVINQLYQSKQPFFVTLLTGSNHIPVIIPEDIPFRPKPIYFEKQAVEYSDWALKRFMELASKQQWFENTLFVFVSDHGAAIVKGDYDMPLSYHHEPFMIYAPHKLKPTIFHCVGGQIDVFPTMMGLLNIKYVNNTLGIDLLKESRPYIYFSADNRIGCVDKDFFYVYHVDDGTDEIYKYQDQDRNNYIGQYRPNADSMKNYAFSMMQTAQWMISNKKTGPQMEKEDTSQRLMRH